MDATFLAGLIMVVSVLVMLAMSVPIAISIGLGSAMAMLAIQPLSGAMMTSAQKMFTGANSFPLMAIPFFVLAGNIMNNGGIAIRLVNCAKVLSGRMPAPLAQTNIIANMLFGAISGSGAAAAAAIGGTISPLEKEDGYDPNFSAAVNIATAPTGMLIPPSNTLIVYSTVAGSVSVSALFLGGYLPGILWGAACMVYVGIIAKNRGYPVAERLKFSVAAKTVLQAVPSLLLIFIVIGGILGGIFTATEGSAIAVCYTLILSLIYRSLDAAKLKKILLATVETTVIIVFMISVSTIMSFVMAYTRLPDSIGNSILGLTQNKYAILFLMNIVLLIVGCAMDPTPAILIFTPIFLPICLEFGMDPVHFGIIITMNLCIGTITPPVGVILFTGCKVGGVSIESVIRQLLPFFLVTIITLLLVTYIPAISMWIPRLFGLVR
jgi:tripartite ATP-independent transporter DctM subunit